jgi:adenine-specific DNA-methyltransferase
MNLSYFLTEKLYDAGRKFFEQELGIQLSQSAVTNLPAQSLIGDFLKGKDEYLIREIEEAYLLGKVDENNFENKKEKPIDIETESSKDTRTYQGILVFAISAKSKSLSRNEIAKLTRALNRRAKDKPVILITLTGELLSYSTAERAIYKQEWREGEQVGKITMLKDINLQKVHAGHERILWDMRINLLEIDNFSKLYLHWKKVFSVQVLNKNFYQELFHWYLWAKRLIKIPPIPKDEEQDEETLTSIFSIRLLTRLLFVWFVKEKKLISVALFQKEFITDLIKDFNPASDKEGKYYKAVLQNLFFATLNTPMDKDAKSDEERRQFLNPEQRKSARHLDDQYLDQTKYRHDGLINDSKKLIKSLADIPFLNGGLFECLDYREGNSEKRYDGFSTKEKNQPLVPEILFFGKNDDFDLSKDFDDDKKMQHTKVRGIIDILNSYKFTITENTPLEEEIALDPELLGKVFENLLASYNPETKTTARKQTGSFYTPREIVSYMVDESLKSYLLQRLFDKPSGFVEVGKIQGDFFGNNARKGQLKVEVEVKTIPGEAEKKLYGEKLTRLFDYGSEDNPFTKNETQLLIESISKCKILDPACGSGAFPMGILHRMVHLLSKLDPKNNEWKIAQQKKAEHDLQIAQTMSDEEIRAKAIEGAELRIKYIKESFDNPYHELDYTRKLFLIENCIYGVDIQQIAVQIAKLRFFISLMAEQKTDDLRPNRNILSMPNLETKFVAANTLIPLEKPAAQLTLMDMNPEIKKTEDELKNLRSKIFFTRKYSEKKKLHKQEKECREKLKKVLIEHDYKKSVAEQMSGWNPFDQLHHAKFFDTETMFELLPVNINEGVFDIVIGNPPYVEHKKLKHISSELKKYYSTYSGTADLYVYFYEFGIRALRTSGTLVFITSNKFIKTSYGENIRKYFTSYRINEIIDFTDIHVFDALVASCIFSVTNTLTSTNSIRIAFANDTLLDFSDVLDFIEMNKFYLNQDTLSEKIWQLENETNLNLKAKIESESKVMSDINTINIYRGITTGYNPAFIIDDETKSELITNDKSNKTVIKPLLQGRNIKKWIFDKSNEYLLFVPWHFPLHLDESISGASKQAEKLFKERFSILYTHLKQFKKELSDRNVDETGIRYEWYALQRCAASYFPEFDKEKIIWGLTADKWTFAYDNDKNYLPSNGYILTSSEYSIKYLLALLNSRLMEFYFGFIGIMTAGGAYTLKQETVSEFPIKVISPKNQKLFTTLVDKILSAKNSDKDTSALENEIDVMVYKLYNLTYEEVKIIEPYFSISKKEYDALPAIEAEKVEQIGSVEKSKKKRKGKDLSYMQKMDLE